MSDSATNLQAAGVQTGSALLLRKLADFFPADEIKWKPQAVKGNRALALAYINTRAIMDRLDEVVGPDAWEDRYELLSTGDVCCTLKIRVGERWVRKSDVGSQSEQPDGGDRVKAAFSDAFKRAAVKFGIGRYIARMPQQWCDYDPAKKSFVRPPQVPEMFLPKKAAPSSQLRGSNRPVVAGIPRITADEYSHMIGRLKAANISLESVRKHYDLTHLDELPADQFKSVIERADKVISDKSRQPV